MRSLVALTLAILAAPLVAQEQGFVPLFNGRDLDGWEVKEGRPGDKEKWSVKDGILTAQPGAGWLATRKKYGDYVLKLEWRVPENGNSGVFLRVPDLKDKQHPHVEGMEIQILDDHGPQYKDKLQPWQYSGSLYGVAPPSKAVYKGAGQWNAFEITCKGDHIAIVFNGEKIVSVDQSKEPKIDPRPRSGYIGLQNHGSAVEFRNIQIQNLEK